MPRRVLVLDFWSDRNRGDAAMQIALLRLLRSELPDAKLVVMSAFGANQWPEFVDELDESGDLADELVGGFHPTFVDFGSTAPAASKWRARATKALGAVAAVAILPALILLGRLPQLDFLLPKELKRALGAMRSADVVMWNGRNFRSDSRWREPYDVWQLLYNPIVALALGKPVACIGSSIWPLQNRLARAMVRNVLGQTFFLSLREEGSYLRGRELLRGKSTHIELLPDLSLAVLTDNDAGPRERPEVDRPRRLGITLVDSTRLGDAGRRRYVDAMRSVLRRFVDEEGAEVVLIPQVTYEAPRLQRLRDDVLDGFDDQQVTVIEGRPSVEELVQTYRGIDLLIATRMHSAIFALTQGTPVVTIPYDGGGKWAILDMMGAGGLEVTYEGITAELLEEKLDSVWRNRSGLRAAVAASLPDLGTRVADNVKVPLALYRERLVEQQRTGHG